jgi:hypothetical protein
MQGAREPQPSLIADGHQVPNGIKHTVLKEKIAVKFGSYGFQQYNKQRDVHSA